MGRFAFKAIFASGAIGMFALLVTKRVGTNLIGGSSIQQVTE
jgi:hypothetical protein